MDFPIESCAELCKKYVQLLLKRDTRAQRVRREGNRHRHPRYARAQLVRLTSADNRYWYGGIIVICAAHSLLRASLRGNH